MASNLGVTRVVVALTIAGASAALTHDRVHADVSLGVWMQHGPDDLNTATVPGLLTLSGNDATATATMPFSVTIDGTSYSTIAISTIGWIELGGTVARRAAVPRTATAQHRAADGQAHEPFLAVYWDATAPDGTACDDGIPCTTADASAEAGAVTDATTFLSAYSFRQDSRHATRTVTATNELGALSLTTIKPDLLVPTHKDLVSTQRRRT